MSESILPLLLALLSTLAPAKDSLSRPLAFTGVTVIDATGAPARPGMTVLIAAGRITAIGERNTVKIPDGARVVDAAGKFLIPGLWDMHVHWYDAPSLPLFTVNGVTGVRIMCGFPLHLQWRKQLADTRLLGPRLVLAGPIVDGPHPVWPDALRAGNAAEGRQAVRTIKQQGYDCVKVYNLLPRTAYFGVADEAKQLGLPLVGHVPFAINAAEAAAAGQKSIEHLSGVSLACSAREAALRQGWDQVYDDEGNPATELLLRAEVDAERSYDPAKAGAVFASFVKKGAWVVPTLSARKAHAMLDARSALNESRMQYLPVSLKNRWNSRRGATLRKLKPADFANYRASLQRQLKLVDAMHQAGVRFLAGTDTGALDCFPGFSLHTELELLVKAGLTPMEALQTATRNPAEFLDRLPEMGTVERGKVADLVLLEANPLEDIRNTTKVYAVVTNGRLLLPDDLRAMLADVAAACRKVEPEKLPGAHQKYP